MGMPKTILDAGELSVQLAGNWVGAARDPDPISRVRVVEPCPTTGGGHAIVDDGLMRRPRLWDEESSTARS